MHLAATIFALVMKFGGIGLLVLGVLDSSFLIAPWGNDLLVIALTAVHPRLANMLYYAAMSTVGSVLGCLIIDVVLRPLGAKGLERHVRGKRLELVKRKVGQDAALTLAVASLAPPPFPFTAFVMAAAALQYSRHKMLAVVAATRLLRFLVVGYMAIRFGSRILQWSRIPWVQCVMIGIVVISIVGSVLSIYGWLRRSGNRTARSRAEVTER